MKVYGTVYEVHARPVFASPRWRFEIVAPTTLGHFVSVTTSKETFATAEEATAFGADYARRMAAKLRADLR